MTRQLAVLLTELALKSTLFLGLAFAIAALARNLSAEERHTVWMFALFGLLVLPAASLIGPSVAVPVQELAGKFRAPSPDAAGTSPHGTGIAADESKERPVPPGRLDPLEAGAYETAGRWQPVKAAFIVSTLYVAVAVFLLGWFGLATLRVRRLLRRYAPVTDVSLLALLQETRLHYRIRRDIQLRVSHAGSTPWTWGALHPVIVLPRGFARLPAASQRNVLHHEVSHIARLDFLTTIAGCICCALYWFQPLTWLAFRHMTQESERACDVRVLLAGGSSTEYAAQLLEVARTAYTNNTRPILMTAMAGRSAVAQRISSILDSGTRRKTMNRLKTLCTLSLVLALVALLATVKSQAASTTKRTDAPDPPALAGNVPVDSDALARAVRTSSEQGNTADIHRLFVDYISRGAGDPEAAISDATCRFCGSILKTEDMGNERSELLPALLSAFDEVERRARAANDGDPLLKLAAISAASGSDQAMQRGTYYLLEGFRIGNLGDPSKLAAIDFLADLGWHRQARNLAEQLHNDEFSSLYQSSATEHWIHVLDRRIALSDSVYERLSTPGFTTKVDPEGNIVPLYTRPPLYPPEALAQGVEGEVVLQFTITENGKTDDIRVVRSSNVAFNDVAADALSDFLYAPRLVNGVAAEMTGVEMVMRFKLKFPLT